VPRQKVVAAAGGSVLGAAFAIIILWIVESIASQAGIKVPPEVAEAVKAIVTGICTFSAGYYTPPGESEVVIKAEDGSLKSAIS
jgi:hypothetical protein